MSDRGLATIRLRLVAPDGMGDAEVTIEESGFEVTKDRWTHGTEVVLTAAASASEATWEVVEDAD